MITDFELKKLRADVERSLDNQCTQAFLKWSSAVKQSSFGIESFPSRLIGSMDRFVEENRVAFFINYKEKLRELLKAKLSMLGSQPLVFAAQSQTDGYGEIKDRLFLEAFIRNRGNGRRAALDLKIPKSTRHDWLSKHKELVRSELNKTNARLRELPK